MPNIAFIILIFPLYVSGALKKSNYFIDDTNYIRHRRQTENSRCVLPSHPQHGRWKLLNGEAKPGDVVPLASVVVFKCNSGYKLSTNTSLVCLGDWSTQAPQCDELCPPLHSTSTYDLKCIDKVGKEVNCTEATHGTTLDYSCKPFFETPFGYKKTLFCENGKWDYSKPMCKPVCGKKISDDKRTLIYGPKPNKNMENPWIAAIYKKMGDLYKNICAGSILSQTVVLTAAHCITNDFGEVLPKENYKVGVGKLYRSYEAIEDKRAQYLDLSNIIVPEEYKAGIRKFAADIAVLVIKGEIILNELVQPVCFANMKNIHLRAGNKGEVSGWGVSEGDMPSEILRTLVIPYKHEMICAEELPPDWADRYNLKDKICVGFINKSKGVCSGDSGAGLAFKYEEDNRYYIHGIVSLAHQVDAMCNIQQNALYTSVASYYDFVDRLLTKYTPKIKDCVLPPYPKNGVYSTDPRGLSPGDLVSSDTILKFECPDIAVLYLSSTRHLKCSEALDIPTCERRCSQIKFRIGVSYRCFSREGLDINCRHAIQGATLEYNCPKGFRRVDNLPRRTCVDGSWGSPKPECVRECGIRNVSDGGLEHPWNVGIYKFNHTRQQYQYVCGGLLVAENIVVTAAQCVTDELGYTLPINDFSVAAGKLYRRYDDARDTEAQCANITFFSIHPQYKSLKKLSRNIAFLITSSLFTFNNFVQQICLVELDSGYWSSIKSLQLLVVGWRFTEDVSPEKMEPLEVSLVSSNDCKKPSSLTEKNRLGFIFDKSCYKFKNESTCLLPEDHGKGVIAKISGNGRYYLYTVVGSFEYDECRNHFWGCDIDHYAEYIYSLNSHLNTFL